MTRPTADVFGVGARLLGVVIDGVDDEGRGRTVVDASGNITDDADNPDDVWDVAVRGGMPGDVCDVVVERAFPARRLVQARRLGALGPGAGPLHIERRCTHSGPCAACPLHGVDRGFVAALKTQRVRQAIVDVGVDHSVVHPCVAGGGTRQKVKLVAKVDDGVLRLGHYVPHSHDVVDADGCAATDDEMQRHTAALKENLQHSGIAELVIAVILRRFEEGVAAVVVAKAPCPISLESLVPPGLLGLSWRTQDVGASANAIVGGHVDAYVGVVVGTPLGGGAPCVVDAFCQADAVGAAWLVDRACAFVLDGVTAGERFLDLYAGSGAFARVLAQRALGAEHGGEKPVLAVERFPPSVLALAALPGVVAWEGAVEDVIDDVLTTPGGPIVGAVVDPPKKGLGPVASWLARLHTLRRVAVVSCDVDAGARDVDAFVRAGFVVDACIPVDLFVDSAEVEMLTLLRRP
jgi:tRNA/tmRNA/rRNA uracil-C5-methylase (TrmA/RlmC/RlmD family)